MRLFNYLYNLFQTLYSFSYLSTQKWTKLPGSSSPTELIYLLKDNVCIKIPWLLIVTPFFILPSCTPFQILCNINANNYVSLVALIISVTLYLTGSFSFRITPVKIEIHQHKELGIQQRQHTTTKKIAQLRDRQNENTNIDLKTTATKKSRCMHSKRALSWHCCVFVLFLNNAVNLSELRRLVF